MKSTLSADSNIPHAKHYLAAWRWHFFAGLYVIPFLLILAVTGLAMLWTSALVGRDGERTSVSTGDVAHPVSELAEVARRAVSDGTLVQYIAPLSDDRAALFSMKTPDDTRVLAIDPFTATVLGETSRENSWYAFFDNIHSDLLMGTVGDRLVETAASLGIVLVVTGLYLWWPGRRGLIPALIPRLASRGRSLWKSVHGSLGAWVSVLLFFFLITGLSWTGIWGEKRMQAWNSFPAEKYGAPASDITHASMNHGGTQQVPWALEQTPMPISTGDGHASGHGNGIDEGEGEGADTETTGPAAGTEHRTGVVPRATTPVTIDSMVALAAALGFDARYQLNLPDSPTAVWTISRDSMSSDSRDATTDRTVHVDQYSGEVLADIGFSDYSIYGKAMASGVGFHMGTLGWWNVLLNTVFCLTVIFLCISGVVMWWLRRPANARRLVAPPAPSNMPQWRGAALCGLAISIFFPMAGVALLTIMALDYFLLSRVASFRRAFS